MNLSKFWHSKPALILMALVATVLLVSGAFALLTNNFSFTEPLLHRTPRDIVQRFFRDVADNDQPAITKSLITSTMTSGFFADKLAKRDELIKDLAARGITSVDVQDILWANHCCEPRLVDPDLANDALLTTRVNFSSGDSQILYVQLSHDTPQVDQFDLGGRQVTRNWKVLDIQTTKPSYP